MKQFNTKFAAGEKAWIMHENKPKEVKIACVRIINYEQWTAPSINYGMMDDIEDQYEASLFATKKELLDSFI